MTMFGEIHFGRPPGDPHFDPLPRAQKSKLGQTKKFPPGDNPKDARNTKVQVRKCHKDKIC